MMSLGILPAGVPVGKRLSVEVAGVRPSGRGNHPPSAASPASPWCCWRGYVVHIKLRTR